MSETSSASSAKKPRLPAGASSFQEMVPATLDAIASRATPELEAARLFGDHFGFLLALADAFKQTAGRAEPVQRMLELSHGLTAHCKQMLEQAWIERSRRTALARLMEHVDAWREAGEPPADPFGSMEQEILDIDRERDRAVAATRFAEQWAWLNESATTLRELRDERPADEQPAVDGIIRSAARWRLELETAWMARSFEELLGEPTIEELIELLYPSISFGPKPS